MDAAATSSWGTFKHLPEIPVSLSGCTLEDIISGKVRVRSRASSPRDGKRKSEASPTRYRPLTPRSAEACLMEGILPHELEPLKTDPTSDADAVDSKLAKLRKDAREESRQHKVSAVRAARASIIANPTSPSNKALKLLDKPDAKPVDLAKFMIESSHTVVPTVLFSDTDSDKGSLHSLKSSEQQRLEMLKRRHQMEIRQALVEEIKQTEYQMLSEKRLAMDNARRQQAERERLMRKQEHERERLERQEAKTLEEQRRHKEATAAFMKEIQGKLEHDKSMAAKRKQQRAEALQKEQSRQARLEHIRTMLEVQAEQRQREMEERAKHLDEEEVVREARRKALERERHQRAAERRLETERRLQSTLEAAKRLEEERIAKIAEKDAAARARQMEKARQEMQSRSTKRQFSQAEQRKQEQMLEELRRLEESKRAALLAKQQEEALAVERRLKQVASEAAARAERQALHEEVRREAVERQRRKEEYHRLITFQATAEKNVRAKIIAQTKEATVKQRQLLAYDMAQQRTKVMEAVIKAKKTGNWKIAEDVLGMPLDLPPSITKPGTTTTTTTTASKPATAVSGGRPNTGLTPAAARQRLEAIRRPEAFQYVSENPADGSPTINKLPIIVNTGRPKTSVDTARSRRGETNTSSTPAPYKPEIIELDSPLLSQQQYNTHAEDNGVGGGATDGDDQANTTTTTTTTTTAMFGSSDFTLKANALAAMIHQAQRDFGTLVSAASSSPPPLPQA